MSGHVERTAVIDMGSNSWRLVVYGWKPGGWWKLVDEIREAVRIGERMGKELTLKPEPMERAFQAAAVFASFCRSSGVDDVHAVATSAIRDAVNRDELLDAIRDRTGLRVRVLSGEEEARYGWLAVANSTTVADGFGLDVGGGSIQVLRLQRRQPADAVSLPLGAVRVTEAFLPGEEAKRKQMDALREHVAAQLERLGWLSGGGRLAGIGGTIRNLAAAAQKRDDHPGTGVQGYVLSRAALDDLVDELSSRPVGKRAALPGIKADRGDVILGGALVVQTVMEVGEFDGIELTRFGLREGVFLERFLGEERPLTPDVRRDAVDRLAEWFRPDRRHDRHVARLSQELLQGLAAAGLAEPSTADGELLEAACMLHDVGTAVDYDDHHKHSHYLILSAGLPGFTPRELLLVALVARWHRKGEPDASELGSIGRDDDAHRLDLLAGIVRMAEQLERSRDGVIRSVSVEADGDGVRLRAHATGDATVPVWAAKRNAALLERALGGEVEVVRA